MFPKKFVIITNGVVTGWGVVYVEGGVISGPPGSVTVEVPADSPIDVGWSAVFDDETQKWIFTAPRALAAAVTTDSVSDDDGGDAGNGNPPPPPPKNGG